MPRPSPASELAGQLDGWLSTAASTLSSSSSSAAGTVRAVICPHAGFSYSGATAGYSYHHLDLARTRRVFVLGPSHHHYTRVCELSGVSEYETPLGNLTLDEDVIAELKASGLFETMTLGVDEDEHSIEMQLPYLAHLAKGVEGVTVVPVLVGSLDAEGHAQYGQFFAKYLADPDNVFVISSDFCHWGRRFSFTFYDESKGEIWESITALDRLGMDYIEALDPPGFAAYQKKYRNTICGRNPIAVLLEAVAALKAGGEQGFHMRFVHYAQSSHCRSKNDSSVSYAAGVLTQSSGE